MKMTIIGQPEKKRFSTLFNTLRLILTAALLLSVLCLPAWSADYRKPTPLATFEKGALYKIGGIKVLEFTGKR